MTTQRKPIIHGRDHEWGGADQFGIVWEDVGTGAGIWGGFATYGDMILANPDLMHYWPADETSDSLIDRAVVTGPPSYGGAADMSVTIVSGYPQYGAPGPFVDFPETTAIVNSGPLIPVAGAHCGFSATLWSGTTPAWATDLWTIEVWIYLTNYNTSGSRMILVDGGPEWSAPPGGIWLILDALGVVRFQAAIAPSALALGAWTHVVGRHGATTNDLFLNGVQVASAANGAGGVTEQLNSPLFFTNHTDPSSEPFQGRACQLALYKIALDDETIAMHSGSS